MQRFTVGVVGNPNCGKTTLFNVLTGTRQRVGNWPGVTVDRKVGYYTHQDCEIELVDLPGIYSLDVIHENASLDEQIAQHYLLTQSSPQLIINVVDASNLERNLYLTTQLLEMGVPLVVVVNMMDLARQQQIEINLDMLARQLGVKVIPISAAKKEGIERLKTVICQAVHHPRFPIIAFNYPNPIEHAIRRLLPDLQQRLPEQEQPYSRWVALKLLENELSIIEPELFDQSLKDKLLNLQSKLGEELDEDIDIVVADSRYSFIGEITQHSLKKPGKVTQRFSDKIDKVVLNRFLGIPIFLVIMYLMFMFTINVGGAFIDFFDSLFGTVLVSGLGYYLTMAGVPELLILILADGLGGGVQVVATFIPIIGFLFLFLSFLEDSGYMARAAFIMDRSMRFIGLPGKSFVPLVVGFGCNVPAIMASRILENPRDRLLTILMTPFMSCGARLPVYALFAVAFFPVGGQNVVFGLYLIGIALAIVTGLIMKKTLLQGEALPFLMELPPYHLPRLQNVFLHTWDRLKAFIFTAGQVIVPMVMVLTLLNAWNTDGSLGHGESKESVLSEIGRTLTPIFQPMGLTEDNWPATVGIFTGILAKEAVIGTLDALYTQIGNAGNVGEASAEQAVEFNFWEGITAAWQTVPDNLSAIKDSFLDPLGMTAATEDQAEIGNVTFQAMVNSFEGQAGAFAYLLFILLYAPCAAAVAAIYRESGARWALWVVVWTTGTAYWSATLFYQAATFSQHSIQSLLWIVGLLTGLLLVLFSLSLYARRGLPSLTPLYPLNKDNSSTPLP